MRQKKLDLDRFHWTGLSRFAAVAVLLAGCFAGSSVAQQQGQKTFSSAEEASKALVAATKSSDENAIREILGPDGKQIVSSGDDAEDAEDRANFVQKYETMHRLVREPDGTVTLYIGAENWPTPIPLMKSGNGWYFDTEAGKKEILYRRVGQNELSAIGVCEQLVAAEKEYYSSQHNEYAQKFFSDEGKHDGLYWKADSGQPQSPIGPLVASAVVEGYSKTQNGSPTPYHGYYFRILNPGESGAGAAKSYLVDGKMTGGFAFVAYPAEYRSSGVMTFIMGQDGVVYQKDLGRKSEAAAKEMKEYNPDSKWQKAELPGQETAGNQEAK